MKARYRKTLLGFVWVILSPMILFAVQSLIFRDVLGLQVPSYATFLLGGLLPWTFMSSTLDMGIPVLMNSGGILKSFHINPAILVLSQVLDNFINFAAAFFLVLVPVKLFNGGGWELLLLPLPMMAMFVIISSLTLVGSLMNVFLRDVRYVVAFSLNILFFLTPIFYPPDFIPEKFRWMVGLNPFFHIVESFRTLVWGDQLEFFWRALGMSWGIGLVCCLFAIYYWKNRKNELYFTI
jgi:ABC-type polysaccharide/polyol phosphate export permease